MCVFSLAQLQQMRTIVAQAPGRTDDAMREMLEALLPILPPTAAALVYELVLMVNPEEIVDDYDYPLDARTN